MSINVPWLWQLGGWREAQSCLAVLPMALAQAGCRAQLGCHILAVSTPRASEGPAQTPALFLRGLSGSIASGFSSHGEQFSGMTFQQCL